MNKIVSKTVGKIKLLSILSAAILVVGIVLCAIFGLNNSAVRADKQYLTVSMNRITFKNEKADVEELCSSVFEEKNVNYVEKIVSELSGDTAQIVYVFDKDADLTAVKTTLETQFAAQPENGLVVSKGEAVAHQAIVKEENWRSARAAIAVTVFAVFATLYVYLRYKAAQSLAFGASLVVAGGLTFALMACTRIPVTSTFAYVLLTAVFAAAVGGLLTLNKFRSAQKDGALKELSAEESIVNSVALKANVIFFAALLIAFVLLGAIAATNVRWFALGGIVGLVSAAFASVIFMPAVWLPIKKALDKRAEMRARYDYKKAPVAKSEKEEKTEEQSA